MLTLFFIIFHYFSKNNRYNSKIIVTRFADGLTGSHGGPLHRDGHCRRDRRCLALQAGATPGPPASRSVSHAGLRDGPTDLTGKSRFRVSGRCTRRQRRRPGPRRLTAPARTSGSGDDVLAAITMVELAVAVISRQWAAAPGRGPTGACAQADAGLLPGPSY